MVALFWQCFKVTLGSWQLIRYTMQLFYKLEFFLFTLKVLLLAIDTNTGYELLVKNSIQILD